MYEPGKMTPCDYGVRHPTPNTNFTEENKVVWALEDNTDIFVNRIIQDQLPQAITLEILRAAASTDPELQLLKEDILATKTCCNHLISFREIFRKSSHHVNTNKGSIVKQSGNDVEGCRSQEILFQPNMRVFLQYSVNVVFI